MVSIIRNQVLKHLSKFTKNLSVENIQLSALKGRCELQNLELNEDLLMELLELPSWLSLTRAFCNSAVLKVPWTKLKSEPIIITLDCVEIQVETCEQLRNVVASTKPSYTSGVYGFAEQTLDSITIIVNSVNIHLRSPAFEATLDLQRLIVDSRTPNWQKADLRHCRLKNRDTNELLLFKQIEWQTMRIEAKVSSSPSTPVQPLLSPIRLLTSSARCRLTLKKRLADCSLVTSRLFVVFEQLLWVLTDAQLVAALHFAHSLADLIEKATDLAHKLQAGKHLSLPIVDSSLGGKGISRKETMCLTAVWRAYDIAETSYHVFCTVIDLHLVDETAAGSECRSGLPELDKGGCLQVTLKNLQVDHYPFHRACVGRDHWLRYVEPNGDRVPWLEEIHNNYAKKHNLMCAEGEYRVPLHLMCSTTLLIVDKFTIYKVSTSSRAERQPFLNNYNIASEKAIFIDFTSYYYPGSSPNLAPPMPYFYANFGPNIIRLDVPTVLWTFAFFRSVLRENLFTFNGDAPTASCRFEVYLTKVMFDEVVAQCSRIICSNSREGISSSRAELKQALDSFSRGPLFFETNKYPWSDGDLRTPPGAPAICPEIVNHCISDECSIPEVWSVCLDPIWVDFLEKGHRPEAILDPLPLTLWCCQKQILAHVRGLVNVQICHEHFEKLVDKSRTLKVLAHQLKQDIKRSSSSAGSGPLDIMVAAMLPLVHVSLVLKANAGFSMAPPRQEHFNSDDSARSESPPTISSCESIPPTGGADAAGAATSANLGPGRGPGQDPLLAEVQQSISALSMAASLPIATSTTTTAAALTPDRLSRPGGLGQGPGSCADSLSVSMSLAGEEALDAVSVRSDESDSLLAERFVGMLESSGRSSVLNGSGPGGIVVRAGRGEELLADIELAEEAAEDHGGGNRDPNDMDDIDALYDEDHLLLSGASTRSQTVAVIVLKVRDIQLALTNDAFLYQMHSIEFEENPSIDREVYHAEFSARTRTMVQQNGLNKQLAATCLASGRFELEESQLFQLLVQGLEFKLSSGSLAGLADMVCQSGNGKTDGHHSNAHASSGPNGTDPVGEGSIMNSLPISARLLLYDIKVRASPDQLVVIPHCLIERPWNAEGESPVFLLPVAFSSLDESVELLLRRNIDRDKLPPSAGIGQTLSSQSVQTQQQLMTRVQLLENDNNLLRSQEKIWKSENEKLAQDNAMFRAEIERIQREMELRIATLQMSSFQEPQQ